jgi:hypothetical protein
LRILRQNSGNLFQSEIREITDVIEQFDDPDLTRLTAEVVGAFLWQLPHARWKITFFRKVQARVAQIARERITRLAAKRLWTQPLKIGVTSQWVTPLRGVGGDWSGKEISDEIS